MDIIKLLWHLALAERQNETVTLLVLTSQLVPIKRLELLFLRALKTDRKTRFTSLFPRMQIMFLFNENVCILYLSCNIKKSKTVAKLSANN
jgi:hypothetical protein